MIGLCAESVTKGAPDDPYNSARLIVRSAEAVDTSGSLGFAAGMNGRIFIQYASPEEAESAAARLKLDPAVKYAVPDTEYRVEFENTGGSPFALGDFNSWGYGEEHVDMAALQERVLSKYGGEIDNLPEIIVAVCDSGVNVSHEFLAGRTVAGYDFVNGDSDPSDGFGHGTSCAGVVADGTLPNGGYQAQTGTSMVSPHAAAACAMLKSRDPKMGADEIMSAIKNAAVDHGIAGGGTGVLCMTALIGESTLIPGDADGNGSVNVSDALLALRRAMGLIGDEAINTEAADMDGDGTVSVTDAVTILRTAMGLI